jgi:hypothetical protein
MTVWYAYASNNPSLSMTTYSVSLDPLFGDEPTVVIFAQIRREKVLYRKCLSSYQLSWYDAVMQMTGTSPIP